MRPNRYRGPEGERMLGWGDLYALFDDHCPLILPNGHRHHLGEFIVAILRDDLALATSSLARYNEDHGVEVRP